MQWYGRTSRPLLETFVAQQILGEDFLLFKELSSLNWQLGLIIPLPLRGGLENKAAELERTLCDTPAKVNFLPFLAALS